MFGLVLPLINDCVDIDGDPETDAINVREASQRGRE